VGLALVAIPFAIITAGAVLFFLASFRAVHWLVDTASGRRPSVRRVPVEARKWVLIACALAALGVACLESAIPNAHALQKAINAAWIAAPIWALFIEFARRPVVTEATNREAQRLT